MKARQKYTPRTKNGKSFAKVRHARRVTRGLEGFGNAKKLRNGETKNKTKKSVKVKVVEDE